MTLTFQTTITDDKLDLTLPSGSRIQLLPCNHTRFELATDNLFLLTKKSKIMMIAADKSLIPKLEFDQVVRIQPADDTLEISQLVQYLVETAESAGIKLKAKPQSLKLPKNIYNACAKTANEWLTALSAFNIKVERSKAFVAKAQHRWKKAISEVEFEVRHEGTSGIVIWEKSTQMRLKKGAQLLPDSDAPLRADGTLGFTAKFALNLREENKDKIDKKTWTTTDDVILRSVNEIGHFLYFAGTNSWLELYDAEGHSIHELTVVK